MGGVLLGFALGAVTFTAQGRELGNKLGAAMMDQIGKVIDSAKKPAEQFTGTTRDPSNLG